MRALILDTETTGVDPFNDRIVTLFIGVIEDNGEFSREKHWLFNPGIEIPEAASEVHGITTEKAQKHGIQPQDHQENLTLIRDLIIDTLRNLHIPVVAYNATFDFTLLNAEFVRNGVNPISWDDLFVIDPLVVDRGLDKWRKGGRTLVAVAQHYKVTVDPEKAHDAAYDCYLTGQVLQALAAHTELQGLTRSELHRKQKSWKVEQAASLQAYLRKQNNDPNLIINNEWPVLNSPA